MCVCLCVCVCAACLCMFAYMCMCVCIVFVHVCMHVCVCADRHTKCKVTTVAFQSKFDVGIFVLPWIYHFVTSAVKCQSQRREFSEARKEDMRVWSHCQIQCLHNRSLGAVWKSRWSSWAPVPNKPMVSVDIKQHSTKSVCIPSLTTTRKLRR